MGILPDIAFWSGAALCLPASVLLLEILAGFCRSKQLSASKAPGRAVLLIPAHNEAAGIAQTLERVAKTDSAGLRVIVIADNCSDDTARIARECGAEVFERVDPLLRGKSYALAWALSRLAEDPPEVVVFLDADCWFQAGGPMKLAAQALESQRPMQCINLVEGKGLGAFAFRFRNEARLRGLHALGVPVQITGTGFAIPWELLQQVPLPLGELAEDAVWGWSFCRAGHGVGLAVDTVVGSAQPLNDKDAGVQRRRWEHGILSAALKNLPALCRSAFFPPRWRRIFHLFDVVVPPLALLVLLLAISLAIGLAGGQLSALFPVSIAFGMAAAAVMIGWTAYGRGYLPLTGLMLAPTYAMKKSGLYLSFYFRRERNWVRTPRGETE